MAGTPPSKLLSLTLLFIKMVSAKKIALCLAVAAAAPSVFAAERESPSAVATYPPLGP